MSHGNAAAHVGVCVSLSHDISLNNQSSPSLPPSLPQWAHVRGNDNLWYIYDHLWYSYDHLWYIYDHLWYSYDNLWYIYDHL